MGRPRTVSDDALLDAARAGLRDEGPSVTLASIGRRAGLSAAAVLRRFGSKDELLFAALRPPGEPTFLHSLSDGPGAGDGPDQLAGILADLCRSFEVSAPSLAALRTSGLDATKLFPPSRPGPAQQTRSEVRRWLSALVARGQLSVEDPETAAELLVGACEARGFLGWVGLLEPADPLEPWCRRLLDSIR